jgi:hypothetical protein
MPTTSHITLSDSKAEKDNLIDYHNVTLTGAQIVSHISPSENTFTVFMLRDSFPRRKKMFWIMAADVKE